MNIKTVGNVIKGILTLSICILVLFGCQDGGSNNNNNNNNNRGGEEKLREAIAEVLPQLKEFKLVQFDDRGVIDRIKELAEKGAFERVEKPIQVELPVLLRDGVQDYPFIAYPHNVYSDPEEPNRRGVPVIAFNGNGEDEKVIQTLQGPSLTFQGMPDLSEEELIKLVEGDDRKQLADESRYQPSVISVIGNSLEAAYYGPNAADGGSILESLDSLLGMHYGEDEVKRLTALVDENYLVYNQSDFQPPVEHGETFPPDQKERRLAGQSHIRHVAGKPLNWVMVADDTVYDPDTGTWLVSNWFARTASAANRANFYWRWAQIGPKIPNSATTLPASVGFYNNSISIRSILREYRVLTPFGKSILNNPGQLCGGANHYLNEVRKISHNSERFPNELWMWWTKHYGGGCAYISTLHRAPRDYSVGVSGYGNGTTDWVSFIAMHEGGHIIGGTHNTNAPGSPETRDSHRCRFLGFINFGPTGPSLMSYAGGTRTYCFALTDADGSPKKNTTKVAEFLYLRLD